MQIIGGIKTFYKIVQNEFHATCKVLSHSLFFAAWSSTFHWKTKLYDSNLFICLFFFPCVRTNTPEHIDNKWLTTSAATMAATMVVVVLVAVIYKRKKNLNECISAECTVPFKWKANSVNSIKRTRFYPNAWMNELAFVWELSKTLIVSIQYTATWTKKSYDMNRKEGMEKRSISTANKKFRYRNLHSHKSSYHIRTKCWIWALCLQNVH